MLSTAPGALLPGGCSRISKWVWPHLAAFDWLSQGDVLLDPIRMFAFKLKHFEFLLHLHISEGHSHITLSAQKVEGSFPRPCHVWCLTLLVSPWAGCSLSLAALVGPPPPRCGWAGAASFLGCRKVTRKSIHEQTNHANRWGKSKLS